MAKAHLGERLGELGSPRGSMAMGLSPECTLGLGAKGERLFKHRPPRQIVPSLTAIFLLPSAKITKTGAILRRSVNKSNFPVIWCEAPLSKIQDEEQEVIPVNVSDEDGFVLS